MKNIILALRSLTKRGQHNLLKVISLGIGLAVGLVLIAKVCFEQSYDNFYPDSERVYRIFLEDASDGDGDLVIRIENEGFSHDIPANLPGNLIGNQGIIRTRKRFLCVSSYHRTWKDVEETTVGHINRCLEFSLRVGHGERSI